MDSQQVDLLMEDRIAHQETILIIEEEAYASRVAWAHLVGLSQGTLIQTQHQAELLALREEQRRARQPGRDVRVPDHQDDSRGAALTWWNGQIRTSGPDAYSMTWEVLKKKMTDKYCPLGEIKKLEIKLWNLKVKGTDVPTYNECF
ncbi:reverse transcriptase domain-containing protein [Tanacetum coccineum]